MIKYLNLHHEAILDNFISVLETDEENIKKILTDGDYNNKDLKELTETVRKLREAINSLSKLANYR